MFEFPESRSEVCQATKRVVQTDSTTELASDAYHAERAQLRMLDTLDEFKAIPDTDPLLPLPDRRSSPAAPDDDPEEPPAMTDEFHMQTQMKVPIVVSPRPFKKLCW